MYSKSLSMPKKNKVFNIKNKSTLGQGVIKVAVTARCVCTGVAVII